MFKPLSKGTIATRIPRKHLRTFAFYAKHYEIPINYLMQSQVYGQALVLTDDVFWALEMMEDDHSTEDLEEITLEFSSTVHRLLVRVSELLRRPLDELAQDLLSVGGRVMADYIAEALNKDGMDIDSTTTWSMADWADEAIEFARCAKQNKSPKGKDDFDCWDSFAIQKPKRKAPKTSGISSRKGVHPAG